MQQATNVLSALFAQHLFKSVTVSALSIAVTLIVTRCLPKIPGGVRSFLWCVVLARCIAGTVCDFTIAIPVTPAARPVLEQVRNYAYHPLSQVGIGHIRISSVGKRQTASDNTPIHTTVPVPRSQTIFSFPICFTSLWLAGFFCICFARVRAFGKVTKIVSSASPVDAPDTLEDLTTLAKALNLKKLPTLRISPSTETPFAFGIVKPAIVLPEGSSTLSRADMRMTLAHELAHIKRMDPLWGLIPELARVIFFYNPLVYIAVQEYLVAREEACDQIAVALTSTSSRSYAELLLRHIIRLNWAQNPPTTATMSAAHRVMKRRLLSLKTASSLRPSRSLLALQITLPLIIIPWQATMHLSPVLTMPSLSNMPLVRMYLPVLMSGSGLNVTNATAINYSGDVIGVAKTKAVLWHGNSLVPLDSGRFRISVPSGISDSGMIVGSQYNNPQRLHGFAWTPASHTLPNVQGFRYIEPIAVNSAGDIVGDARSGTKDHFGAIDSHAFLMKSGQMTDLGTLGGEHSCALGINANDVIVGKSDVNRGLVSSLETTAPQTHAFEWISGQMKDLGTLGGPNSLAYAVSNSGDIAGYSDTIYGTVHAFIFQAGQMHDLSPLDGDDTSVATYVNDRGQAVGYSSNQQSDNSQRAVLWSNGVIEDLNSLLPRNSEWVLQSAHAINDKGEIVGRGTFHGHPSGFLLVPAAT